MSSNIIYGPGVEFRSFQAAAAEIFKNLVWNENGNTRCGNLRADVIVHSVCSWQGDKDARRTSDRPDRPASSLSQGLTKCCPEKLDTSVPVTCTRHLSRNDEQLA